MFWNYRVVKYRNESGYGLHEVFYNDDGEAENMTEKPIGFRCDLSEGPEEIIGDLENALEDARKHPVLEEPESWPETIEPE